MYKVLLIEDDSRIRDIITTYFQKRDIIVDEAIDGYNGLSMINESYHIILLDIMMPGIDGIEVCKQIRNKYNTPIIFISALSEEETQLQAFESGADDYVSKPFLPSVLYAKCIAIIKRQVHMHQTKTFNHLSIDYTNRQVFIDDQEIYLTSKEYLLIEYFSLHENILLFRDVLVDNLWGYDYLGDGRVVDSYVKKLRKKLYPYQYIHTRFNEGYIFKAGDQDEETI